MSALSDLTRIIFSGPVFHSLTAEEARCRRNRQRQETQHAGKLYKQQLACWCKLQLQWRKGCKPHTRWHFFGGLRTGPVQWLGELAFIRDDLEAGSDRNQFALFTEANICWRRVTTLNWLTNFWILTTIWTRMSRIATVQLTNISPFNLSNLQAVCALAMEYRRRMIKTP